MENHLELKKNQQSLGTSSNTILPQASQRVKPRERFHPEKPNLSYADLHLEIIKNVKDNSSKSSASHQKQRIGRETTEEDELVKYMSNLPSFLEKRVSPQEKVLNVGVLDWGRLEKWQYGHKQIPNGNSRYSVCSSYTSSSFSTDGSSAHSSRDHSSSPARRRMRRPSLQFHLMASPIEGHSQAVKSVGEDVGKFQDVKASKSSSVSVSERGKFIRTDQPFSKNRPEIKLEQCRRKDSEPKIDPESRTFLPDGVKYGVVSSTKVKIKTQEGEFTRRVEKLQEQNSCVVDQDVPRKSETVVLLLPKDFTQKNHSGLSQTSDSVARLGRRPAETNRKNFSEISNEAYHADDTDIPHSRSMSCEIDCSKHSQMKQTGSIDAEGKSLCSERSRSVPRAAKVGISPSRGRNLEDKKSTVTITKSTANEPSKGSDLKGSKVAAEKLRSTSPFRRFSISMGKMSKGSSSKEDFATLQSDSIHVSAKSGSENAVASCCSETSSGDRPNATTRARSSPLRRLLDPLLKPKVANCRHSGEPLHRDSISTDSACKSSNGRSDASTGTVHSGKVRLDMTSCRTINVNDPAQEKKHGLSAVQALLRVAIKNGLPLFTFAVDNNSDVLVATMKKLSTLRKDDHCCLYTFFSIQEVKKKNGRWMNQRSKGKGHDIIPNVVAQMKASGSQFFNLTRQNRMDQSGLREFVLCSVDFRQVDQQTSTVQPSDELAAIVVKIPEKFNQSSIRDGRQIDNYNSLTDVKEGLPVVRCSSGENGQGQPFVSNQDLINATVILPSGAHSLPGKGGPSSLIERWKSGGSCDCGGWDLGCKLRILANQNQIKKKSNLSEACTIADRFELFSQGGVEENQPVFCLAPFKDGIYSVEFNSSLSLLQAFSICIAILDSKKLCELSESSKSFEEKTSVETIFVQNDGVRAPNRIEGEIPARYVSYPPHSPVGRV